jgi:hypothetical protein
MRPNKYYCFVGPPPSPGIKGDLCHILQAGDSRHRKDPAVEVRGSFLDDDPLGEDLVAEFAGQGGQEWWEIER